MQARSEVVTEKVPVKPCPKCGKVHVYLINITRKVQPDEPGFGIIISPKGKAFNVLFECPSKKETFSCQVSIVERHGIEVCEISVHGVYEPSKASSNLFELVDNLTYDPQACESNYQPWFSELVRIAIRAFRKETDRNAACRNFLESCRPMLGYVYHERLIDLFDHLFSLQWKLTDDQWYRDHIYHSICVFLLGYYILNQKYVLPNYFYCFEGGTPLLSSQCNKVFNHYCPHNCDGTQTIYNIDPDLEGWEVTGLQFYGDRLLQVYHNWNIAWLLASLFHDIGYPVEKAPQKYTKKFGIVTIESHSDELRELIRCYNVLNSAHLSLDALLPCTTYDHKPSRLLHDHGLVSAVTLLKVMKSLTNESWAPVRRAALAVALHNLAGRYRGKIRIDAEKDPLSFLLIVCDEIQEWGREDLGKKGRQKPYIARLNSLAVDAKTYSGGIISIEANLQIQLSQKGANTKTILKEVRRRLADREKGLRQLLCFNGRYHVRLALYHEEALIGDIILPDRRLWDTFRPGRISEVRRRLISLRENQLSCGGIMHEEIRSAIAEELRILKEIDFEEQSWREVWGTF